MTRLPDLRLIRALRLPAAVALLGGLAGSVGCASVTPRTMTFREAGLVDPGTEDQPNRSPPAGMRPPASTLSRSRSGAGQPSDVPGPQIEPHPSVIPPIHDVAPEAVPSELPDGPPIDPVLLRFAAEARLRRLRATPGQGFPAAAEVAWRGLVDQLDAYLTRSLPQTPLLELVRSSMTVETEWDFDQRRYGSPPATLARLIGSRAGRLSARIATSRAIGNSMFATRPPGRLRWPIENAGLSSPFGPRNHPLDGMRQLHAGIDLVAEPGRVVSTATKGYVVRAGWSGGYGLLVELRHPGELTTRYGHLSALLCAPGDALEAGAPVGLIGQTGFATGPHLHFEVWEGGQPRDPLAFIGGGTGLAVPASASVGQGGGP